MAAQEKLKRLLLMMEMLRPPGSTLHQIAKQVGMTKRSAERYVHLFGEVGLGCDKDDAGRYYLFEPTFRSITVSLSYDEAVFLSDLIAQAAPENPLSPVIQTKLFLRSNAGSRVKNQFKINVPDVIQALSDAMRYNRQVELDTYFSAITGQKVIRILEPLEFTENYRYLLAYEAKDKRVVNLKIDRITSVKILDTTCTQKPGHIKGVDAFHMAANEEFHEVSILLNSLAYRLLIEEYPDTEKHITESDDPQFPFRFAATVYNFLPLGRFCLGLPGAVRIEAPESFLEYLRTRMKAYDW
ncbi:MAG: helix-turn-helix transcriptional regulator [Saprospiraceae bacterium]